MNRNSTLFQPSEASVPVDVDLHKKGKSALSPKPSTIERIRQFARVAFSDASMAGMPAIVLN